MAAVRDEAARSSQRFCLLKAETEDVTPTREVHSSELFKIKACGNFSVRVLYGSLDLIFGKYLLPLLRKSILSITNNFSPFLPVLLSVLIILFQSVSSPFPFVSIGIKFYLQFRYPI
jgi:hypothetical protein